MRIMNAAAPVSRLVLVAPLRNDRDAKIRRYRLARLKLTDDPGRGARRESPFSHLKRVYD
jgi:hypothetical protein